MNRPSVPNPRDRVSPFWSHGFSWYVRGYLRRHVHAVRVAAGTVPRIEPPEAVICYANHPSWWDPLVACFLHDCLFAPRQFFAPMAAPALQQYPVFQRLGFYGVQLASMAGARTFLLQTSALLAHRLTAVWITPGGAFSDVRRRTVFQPGLAHLAHHLASAHRSTDRVRAAHGGGAPANQGPRWPGDIELPAGDPGLPDGGAGVRSDRSAVPSQSACVVLVPLAIEYLFWEERTPEVLVEFGPPQRLARHPLSARPGPNADPATARAPWQAARLRSKADWQADLEQRLAAAQGRLAEKAMARDEAAFEVLLRGRTGIGGVYDWGRRMRAVLMRQRFDPGHARRGERLG